MADLFHPSIYTLSRTPSDTDRHVTATSIEQEETESLISDLLEGAGEKDQVTLLRFTDHNKFLGSTLFRLPAPYVALDASRPWLVYWTTHSLDILGITMDQTLKRRAVSTLMSFLSPLGGFAGGASNTQLPHLLPTYASTCSLAICGDDGPEGGWDKLAANRQATYDFFMSCKRPDGGFVVCKGGEVDVRGTYCLLVVATLLDILTPELLHHVDRFIASAQTYEGGFANATFPLDMYTPTRSPPTAEAHGGYTSCSLLAHFLISSVVPSTEAQSSLGIGYPARINVREALRWSVLMQGEAIEAGGFRGRSNKLVDGCYSWWVGGGVPVLEALLQKEKRAEGKDTSEGDVQLFNNVALQEFILVAAQREAGMGGGLRDKPGKRPDLYHTCNNLSGLSIAQHHMVHSPSQVESNRKAFEPSGGFPAVKPKAEGGGWASEEERQAVRREVWANALGWVESGEPVIVGGKGNRVHATTPVFNILPSRLKPFINYFYGQGP